MSEHRFLRLHTLPAGYGDCLVIEYGNNPNQQHVVIVDGGVASEAMPKLKKLLNSWPDAQIELLVVSHIDDDHISGAIKLLLQKKLAGRIKDIWFNGATYPPPTQPSEVLEKLGFKKGNKLEELLSKETNKLPWNCKFNKSDIVVADPKNNQAVSLPLGAEITLLSPSVAALAALRKAWSIDGLPREENEPNEAAGTEIEPMAGLERMGTSAIPSININEVLKTTIDEDESVSNGSSIAFLFSFGGATLLLGADAHANVLLETAAQLKEGLPRNINVLKLPHHGSAANVTEKLLEAFPANTYIVSTNGSKHEHPHDLAIARIVKQAPGSEVLFNYRCPAYLRWLQFSIDALQKGKLEVGITEVLTIPVNRMEHS